MADGTRRHDSNSSRFGICFEGTKPRMSTSLGAGNDFNTSGYVDEERSQSQFKNLSFWHMCAYVRMYIYIYTNVQICNLYVCVGIHGHMHMHMHTHMHMHVLHVHIHLHLHRHPHLYLQLKIRTYAHACLYPYLCTVHKSLSFHLRRSRLRSAPKQPIPIIKAPILHRATTSTYSPRVEKAFESVLVPLVNLKQIARFSQPMRQNSTYLRRDFMSLQPGCLVAVPARLMGDVMQGYILVKHIQGCFIHHRVNVIMPTH